MQSVFEKIKERSMEEKLNAMLPDGFRSECVTLRTLDTIVNQVEDKTNMGEISDGYHTFNELYHHRAVLFSVICNSHKELAWKSKKHDTGDMYDGMFIVGIETPEGQATYHYDIDPYWDMFEVKELPNAPKWDGHTPDEAIRRIGTLGNDGWIPCNERMPEEHMDKELHMASDLVQVTMIDEDGNSYVLDDCTLDGEWCNAGDLFEVIAWQPLPAPYQPKGDQP